MALVERADGVLSPVETGSIRGSDLPLVEDLRDFISARYTERRGVIETAGRLFEAQVFFSKDGDDYAYVIVDERGVPIASTTPAGEVPASEITIFEEAVSRLDYSEALSPQESISIWDSFIDPEFEELDRHGNKQRRVGWSTFLDIPRAIIIGAPGAGKTTTLRRLTLEFLDRWKKDRTSAFPVYAQMRHFPEGGGVERIVRRSLLEHDGSTNEHVGPTLGSMKILLILDGLDEIAEAEREGVVNALVEFSSTNRVVSILASTRESGYRWELPSFRYFRLLPFNLQRIREWCYYRIGFEAHASWHDFMTSLEERPELLDLAGNPLLLALAVSLYRRSSALPQNRSTLFASYFDAITEQWDSVRGIVRQRDAWAGSTHKLAALCRTAYQLRSYGRETFATTEFVEWSRDFDVDENLLYVCARHTGVVTKIAPESWSFTHRTFSDFLSARYIIYHTDDAKRSLEPFFRSGDWLDIWAYCCGISQDATSLVYLLMHNSRISKRAKLQALGTAFEQDIIVSSGAGHEIVIFLVAEIKRLLVKRNTKVRESKSTKWSLRVNVQEPSYKDLDALVGALRKLRKSKVGDTIQKWLVGSGEKALIRLAVILSTPDVVSLTRGASRLGPSVDIALDNELSRIAGGRPNTPESQLRSRRK